MTEINNGPRFGEVFAECAQGLRKGIARGNITPEEAQALSDKTLRLLTEQQYLFPNLPFDTRSTQLIELIEAGRHIAKERE